MQVSGRIIILTMFGIALALSGGAWWYHYSTTRRAAEFWGAEGARLLVKAPRLEFLELGERAAGAKPQAREEAGEVVAGRAVTAVQDLSDKPGLIHLRFVFTQDANFGWSEIASQRVDVADAQWAYALRFEEGERQLVILLREDFEEIGKLQGERVGVLPSGRIAASVGTYLRDVGVLGGALSRERRVGR